MKKDPLKKLNSGIDRLLFFPGSDNKILVAQKSALISTLYAFVHVFVLTLTFLIFIKPQYISFFINYGYCLLILFPCTILFLFLLPRYFYFIFFIQGLIFNLITFYFILHLGGIATSGGLIFVGITIALSSIPLQKVWVPVSMLILYMITVVLLVALRPWLHFTSQLTPELNSILYMLNTLSMSGASLYFVLSFIKQQRRFEEMESNHMRELNEAKNKLFTNITHEFRTPLTVIKGMADLIEREPDEWLKEGTSKIKNNSNILLKLVNQMLDLAKIETGVMPLHLVLGDINAYIGYVTELFKSMAQNNRIRLSCITMNQPFMMDFDHDKLLHIISNLLSNALKFTPEGGSVEVSSQDDENGSIFSIVVTDTGIGIKPEFLPYIFDRFYQVNNGAGYQPGTGLGLSHTKELVELHKGRIYVESRPDKGTTFIVHLPVSHNADKESLTDTGKMEEQVKTFLPNVNKSKLVASETLPEDKNLPLMLIVEDSGDVSHYLTAILKNEYYIEQAENGKQGLQKALNLIPDIIISDVMMPEMDGIELLEIVKNDMRTSHIPVVMLTAKADISSRLEGLSRGADAYIAKPFDEKELHAILKNLIEIRKKLQERYALIEKQPTIADNEFKMEDAFMIRVRQLLEANLEDDEFGISQVCMELAVSRTQLYRKFRSLSNKTITGYLKELRFSKAKSLLVTTSMNITEVASSAGFKSLSYFSREFSAEFGISPLEFRKMTDLDRAVKK